MPLTLLFSVACLLVAGVGLACGGIEAARQLASRDSRDRLRTSGTAPGLVALAAGVAAALDSQGTVFVLAVFSLLLGCASGLVLAARSNTRAGGVHLLAVVAVATAAFLLGLAAVAVAGAASNAVS